MIYYKHIPVPQDGYQQELNSLIKLLPEWRKEYALSFHNSIDQYLCSKSYFELSLLLYKHYQVPLFPKFQYGPYGKPYLVDYPSLHFNLSHCHKGIICAVGDIHIGVDIETIQYDKELASHILSKTEYLEVVNSEFPEIPFTRYWTMKESTFKLLGVGIDEGKISGILSNNNCEHKLFTNRIDQTISCISINKDDTKHSNNRDFQESKS